MLTDGLTHIRRTPGSGHDISLLALASAAKNLGQIFMLLYSQSIKCVSEDEYMNKQLGKEKQEDHDGPISLT